MLFLGSFSPDKYNVLVSSRFISGFGAGTFIRAFRQVPEDFTESMGANGDGTFVENLNKAGIIEITLAQLAPDNTFLGALADGKTLFPVEVNVKHSYEQAAVAENCIMRKRPELAGDVTPTDAVWEILTINLSLSHKAA